MARTPRRLIDALVALLIVTLAFVGFARPAAAYPPGQSLTVSVKALIQTANANRVEFIVRKAKPGANVRMQFEEVSKSKPANSRALQCSASPHLHQVCTLVRHTASQSVRVHVCTSRMPLCSVPVQQQVQPTT